MTQINTAPKTTAYGDLLPAEIEKLCAEGMFPDAFRVISRIHKPEASDPLGHAFFLNAYIWAKAKNVGKTQECLLEALECLAMTLAAPYATTDPRIYNYFITYLHITEEVPCSLPTNEVSALTRKLLVEYDKDDIRQLSWFTRTALAMHLLRAGGDIAQAKDTCRNAVARAYSRNLYEETFLLLAHASEFGIISDVYEQFFLSCEDAKSQFSQTERRRLLTSLCFTMLRAGLASKVLEYVKLFSDLHESSRPWNRNAEAIVVGIIAIALVEDGNAVAAPVVLGGLLNNQATTIVNITWLVRTFATFYHGKHFEKITGAEHPVGSLKITTHHTLAQLVAMSVGVFDTTNDNPLSL